MASITVLKERLELKKQQLQQAYKAYTALLEGQVQSYSIGSRNLSKLDLPELENTIKKLENEVDNIEGQIRSGGKKRKAVGVVPRDF